MGLTTALGLGTSANDGTGDPVRTGGQTINTNFAALDAANTTRAGEIASLVSRVTALEGTSPVALFACILRQNTPASGWYALDDENHAPLNIASVTNDTDKIIITPSFTWDKIRTVIATPDETFASANVIPGVSVGTSDVRIYLSQFRLDTGYVYYDGAAWQSDGDNIGSVVWDGVNKVTVTHGVMGGFGANVMGAQATPREDGYHVRTKSVGSGSTEFQFYDFAGALQTTESNLMKFHFARHGVAQKLDPTNVANLIANIWVLGICTLEA